MYEEGEEGKHVTHPQIVFSMEEFVYSWSLLTCSTRSTYIIGSRPHTGVDKRGLRKNVYHVCILRLKRF